MWIPSDFPLSLKRVCNQLSIIKNQCQTNRMLNNKKKKPKFNLIERVEKWRRSSSFYSTINTTEFLTFWKNKKRIYLRVPKAILWHESNTLFTFIFYFVAHKHVLFLFYIFWKPFYFEIFLSSLDKKNKNGWMFLKHLFRDSQLSEHMSVLYGSF